MHGMDRVKKCRVSYGEEEVNQARRTPVCIAVSIYIYPSKHRPAALVKLLDPHPPDLDKRRHQLPARALLNARLIGEAEIYDNQLAGRRRLNKWSSWGSGFFWRPSAHSPRHTKGGREGGREGDR